MIAGVLTTCHTQYTSDSSICIFLFNRTTLTVSVTYRTGALYVHRLWFYKHQHDNPVRSKLFVACQRWWFQWRFWFVPSVPGYTRTLSLETVHTTLERNCQMVVVSRIWCRITAGQLYTDNHFEKPLLSDVSKNRSAPRTSSYIPQDLKTSFHDSVANKAGIGWKNRFDPPRHQDSCYENIIFF